MSIQLVQWYIEYARSQAVEGATFVVRIPIDQLYPQDPDPDFTLLREWLVQNDMVWHVDRRDLVLTVCSGGILARL